LITVQKGDDHTNNQQEEAQISQHNGCKVVNRFGQKGKLLMWEASFEG
jgi:hypothetical protein